MFSTFWISLSLLVGHLGVVNYAIIFFPDLSVASYYKHYSNIGYCRVLNWLLTKEKVQLLWQLAEH